MSVIRSKTSSEPASTSACRPVSGALYLTRLGGVLIQADDPLQFHFTASHLLEEYSCAAQIYKLTPADMCELARNSVLQSGWEMQVKKHWIGHHWYLPGAAGNDIHKVSRIRGCEVQPADKADQCPDHPARL